MKKLIAAIAIISLLAAGAAMARTVTAEDDLNWEKIGSGYYWYGADIDKTDDGVELEITETEPGFKGNTATGATKPATVETGYTLNVPLFINEGDRIRIDTRTGEYMARC